MQHVTGQHLYTEQGDDVGEIVDVVGTDGPDLTPQWLAVKTGWFSSRLVPYAVIDLRGDQVVTTIPADRIKHAPKVPVHFEPTGHERDELFAHYGLTIV